MVSPHLWIVALGLASGVVSSVPAQETVRLEEDHSTRNLRRLVGQLADPVQGAAAERSLLRVGREAIVELRRIIWVRGRVVDTRGAQRALRVLGRLGPDASRIYPDLVDALPTVRGEMFFVVVRTLADLVPYSEHRGDPRSVERLLLSHPSVSESVTQSNDRQRFQYALNRFLKRSQVDPRAGLPALIEELRRNRTHRREVAAEVVGRMGPAAVAAIPALAAGLAPGGPVVGQVGGFRVPRFRDEFPQLASEAMVAIAPGDPRTVVAWGWHLSNARTAEERRAAALRLGAFGAAAAGQDEALIDAFRDPSSPVREAAISALGMVGPKARRAVPDLQKLVEGASPGLAARARTALALIRPPAAKSKR